MRVRASKQAIRKAKEALSRKGWNDTKRLEIAKSCNQKLHSQQRSNFFNGKVVEDSTAYKIGFLLDLTWEDGDLEPEVGKKKQDKGSDIDELVQEVRSLYHDKIEYDCGQMQLLNRQAPIDDLYADVYVLEDIAKLRSLNITERIQGFDPSADNPNSFYLGQVRGERVSGLKVVTDGCKVMCLGAPGSGKTSYLYYVAIQCNKGELQANRVPIFIRLIDFTDTIKNQPELSLLNYIENLFHTEGVEQPQAIETIITQGRALILLDGLDEVPKDFSKLVLSRIREFCKYRKNSIIITCRTNALDYNFSDLKFTQVIVADFEQPQIEIFANKWFVTVAKSNKEAGEARATQFLEKLRSREYNRIRDLAVTPILLNLICLVFDNDTGDFPENRAKLYQRGINILLKEWDAQKWDI
ncbi:NACHT domain-containing protein [Microcoleus sp. FACHB-SPT15]|uniref:NACHT domain-containing protein n=1 Tax=Microcoleus sp. FACHB-SPT15 TaxID=2692830 RepID=UPI001781F24F|nr:NACHT domain-containing protein [Microcoleus sp. FACHB-SPT15]MBD1807451.1 NACHT domain-containing protein [Microcoleus sp. FACHB-SPT15]